MVVTVPLDELERLHIAEGATVSVEVREARVEVHPVLPPDLREASDWAIAHSRTGRQRLA
jgi:hypothetical protein